MRKAISILFVFCMCFALVTPCFAAEFENPPIIDGAGYLYEEELEELSVKAEAVRQQYDFEVAIVTESEMSGQDAMSTADDIYDYNGYGGGENDDGILLYICSDTREYHLTTHGTGFTVFNSNGIEYLKENIVEHLANDDYYLAMETYIDLADELLEMAANGEPFDEKPLDKKFVLIVIVCALLIPLLLAKILTGMQMAKMKTAVKNDYAANYMKAGSRRIDVSQDLYLYSHISQVEKQRDDDDDDDGHISSSGRTHGGGGGSF